MAGGSHLELFINPIYLSVISFLLTTHIPISMCVWYLEQMQNKSSIWPCNKKTNIAGEKCSLFIEYRTKIFQKTRKDTKMAAGGLFVLLYSFLHSMLLDIEKFI